MTNTVDNRFVHLYFGRELSELKLTPDLIEKVDSMTRKVYICTNWADLGYFWIPYDYAKSEVFEAWVFDPVPK